MFALRKDYYQYYFGDVKPFVHWTLRRIGQREAHWYNKFDLRDLFFDSCRSLNLIQDSSDVDMNWRKVGVTIQKLENKFLVCTVIRCNGVAVLSLDLFFLLLDILSLKKGKRSDYYWAVCYFSRPLFIPPPRYVSTLSEVACANVEIEALKAQRNLKLNQSAKPLWDWISPPGLVNEIHLISMNFIKIKVINKNK